MIKININKVEYLIYEKYDLPANRESIIKSWLSLAGEKGYTIGREKIEEGFGFTDVIIHAYKEGALRGALWCTNQPDLGAHYYFERFLFHDTRDFNVLITLALTIFRFLIFKEGRDIEISFISRKHTIVRMMGVCGEIMGVSHLEQERLDYQAYIDKVARAKSTKPPQLVGGVLKNIYPERAFQSGDYPESVHYTVCDGSFIVMKVYRDYQKNWAKLSAASGDLKRMTLERVKVLYPEIIAQLDSRIFDIFRYRREIEYLKASDYSVLNILAWKDYREVRYHPLSKGVLISVVEHSGARYFWAPLGVERVDELMDEIRRKGSELHIKQMIKVPEHLLLCPTKHTIDRDNADYIYCPGELLALPRHCAKKRKELQLWQMQSPLTRQMTVKEFVELDRFYRENYDIEGSLKWEYRAFQCFFDLIARNEATNVIIEGAYIKGRLVGFIIAEEREEDVIIHFLKIKRGVKGVSFGIIYDFAGSVESAKYINCMQDLGIEGLKFFKLSLKPEGFIKKYTVELNQ